MCIRDRATTNASRSQKPKLPARLLRDASADGGLETALKALDTNQRKNVNEDALQVVEKAWLQAGLTQEKRICFDATVDALLEKETIDGFELDDLVEKYTGKPAPNPRPEAIAV